MVAAYSLVDMLGVWFPPSSRDRCRVLGLDCRVVGGGEGLPHWSSSLSRNGLKGPYVAEVIARWLPPPCVKLWEEGGGVACCIQSGSLGGAQPSARPRWKRRPTPWCREAPDF